ncbi:MAG: hypothetical protein M0Q22_06880 [Sulfuritalea sp.]|jgi:hypothetical protein|nr:hypothetical protein [Sulfuritalea sp.]
MKRFLWIAAALCLSPTVAVAGEFDEVTRDSEILLVLWTTDDCGFCSRWKGSWGGKRELQDWPDYDKITYREVNRPFRSLDLAAGHFPADLKWLFDARVKSRQLKTGPVPAWTIYVDRKEVEQAYGTSKWSTIIFPLLQELAAEKIALQKQSTDRQVLPK